MQEVTKIFWRPKRKRSLNHSNQPRFWSRPKLSYDQTQSSADPCVPRPKLQGLESGSSAWSGFGLIRGQFGLEGLIIVFLVYTMVWVRSDQRSIRSGRSDHSLYSLDYGLGSVWSEVNSIWKVWFRVHFFQFFLFFLLRDVGSAKRQP